MRLIITEDKNDCGEWSSKYIASKINSFQPTSTKKYFVLGCPTGSTPLPTYKGLVELYNKGLLSFKNVATFNMDEYVGLSGDHPQSYRKFMFDNLFDLVDIDLKNVHLLNGNIANNETGIKKLQLLEEECKRYESDIINYGGIDLFLGGIGPDGHIAFNERT